MNGILSPLEMKQIKKTEICIVRIGRRPWYQIIFSVQVWRVEITVNGEKETHNCWGQNASDIVWDLRNIIGYDIDWTSVSGGWRSVVGLTFQV